VKTSTEFNDEKIHGVLFACYGSWSWRVCGCNITNDVFCKVQTEFTDTI